MSFLRWFGVGLGGLLLNLFLLTLTPPLPSLALAS